MDVPQSHGSALRWDPFSIFGMLPSLDLVAQWIILTVKGGCCALPLYCMSSALSFASFEFPCSTPGKEERGLAPRFGEGLNLGKSHGQFWVTSGLCFRPLNNLFMTWSCPLVNTFTSLATLYLWVFGSCFYNVCDEKATGGRLLQFPSSSLAIFHPLWTSKVH